MESSTGVTLFDPIDLNVDPGNLQAEDEEEIEDRKRRDELLKEQLANAFDDWSEDEDANDERVHSSCSSQDDGEGGGRSGTSHHTSGMIFHKLSDISEHSPNKSGYVSSEISKNESANSGLKVFSSSRRSSNSFKQGSERSSESVKVMDGRGDAEQHFQSIFNINPSTNSNGEFQPIFSTNQSHEKSEHSKSDISEAYRQADQNSSVQLEVLYEVRLREIQRLSAALEEERQATAANKQDLCRKMALLEAEKERAVLSRTEASKLLVESKEQISSLQKEVQSFKQTVKKLEKEKTTSDEVAELAKMQAEELEQRLALMERCDSTKVYVRQTETMVKELKTKHQAETHQLSRQIETLTARLAKKEEECTALEKKVVEMQRAHEALLVEKGDTVNQLARGLEESQAQVRQLMASSTAVDNVRLSTQLDEANRHRDYLEETVHTLQAECSMMQRDLAQYESVSRLTLPHSSSSDETDSIIQMGISHSQSQSHHQSSRRQMGNTNQSDLTSKLKEELHRALLNQKAKRAEIHRLQDLVKEKDRHIQEITKEERVLVAEKETLTEQLNNMMAELKSLHEKRQTNEESSDKTEEISVLNAEVAELRKEKAIAEREKLEIQKKLDEIMKRYNEDKRKDISDYNKEYLKFHDETVARVRKELEQDRDLKIKEYSVRLEQSMKETIELKEMYASLSVAKERATQALGEAESHLRQQTGECERLQKELSDRAAIGDQLAKKANAAEAELKQTTEMSGQLARRVNKLKRENEELSSEIIKLRSQAITPPQQAENQLQQESQRLRDEMCVMSARHTSELAAARAELQAHRERVAQMESDLRSRLQADSEIKTLRQDRDMWKTKCDDKEVQIKKLIESRKRPPATASVATETERVEGGGEVARWREECSVMERAQKEAMDSLSHQHWLAVTRLQESHMQTVELLKQQHAEQVVAVEERTKQLTVEFFAEQVRRLEARYKEEASRQLDPAIIVDRDNQIEKLKHQLASLSEDCRQKVATLQGQVDSDRDKASQLMVQWAQEMKDIQGELKLKEAIIDDQRLKLDRAKAEARKLRNKLIKNNQTMAVTFSNKCGEYKSHLQEAIEEDEKIIFAQIRQMEHVYEEKVKELKKQLKKKQHIT